VVAEVLELEAAGRKERRIDRLRRASKLPPGKTFDTLDKARVPPSVPPPATPGPGGGGERAHWAVRTRAATGPGA